MVYFTHSVRCGLGYGFNEQFNLIVEYDGWPKDTETEDINEIRISNVELLSANNLFQLPLGMFLEKQPLKIFDFYHVNDHKNYWRFAMMVYVRKTTCRKLKKHPKTGHYVTSLYYGLRRDVIVPIDHFCITKDEMVELLNAAVNDINKLTNIQKDQKCLVLTNVTQKYETTLGKVLESKDNIVNEKSVEVIAFDIEQHKKPKQLKVDNEDEFYKFLYYLYSYYREIEKKLEKVGAPIYEVGEITLRNDLDKVEKSYTEMNRTNLLEMYPVMKELFWTYAYFVKFTIKYNSDVYEGYNLPGNWRDIVVWINYIKNWSPDNPGETEENSTSDFESLKKGEKNESEPNRWIKINNRWYQTNEKDGFFILPAKESRITNKMLSSMNLNGIKNNYENLWIDNAKDWSSVNSSETEEKSTTDSSFLKEKEKNESETNRWIKINNRWYQTNEKDGLLILPTEGSGITDKILSSMDLSGVETNYDGLLNEPHLYIRGVINGVFGFINMKRPFEADKNEEKTSYLELVCPLKCSNDVRKWICSNCGYFIKKNDFNLSCFCGIKLFDKELFVCNHPKHLEIEKIKKLPRTLQLIVQQLKKYENVNSSHQEIKKARETIIYQSEEADIVDLISKLKLMDVFDGDTLHEFNTFLGRKR